MLYSFISIVGIFITIFFVIGTHEAAHFIAARAVGVKVLRFSIGFGKALYRFNDKSGTEYVLAMIPLGGYVKMLGEDDEQPISDSDRAHVFNHQPFYKKFFIIVAGPATNILCALILYWLLFSIGFVTVKPIIGNIAPHSIAAKAGMNGKQEIIGIDGNETHTWNGAMFRLLAHIGDHDTATITTKESHHQHIETYMLNLANWHMNELMPDPLTSLGIVPYEPPVPLPPDSLQTIKYNPATAFIHAAREIKDLTYFNLILFGKMLSGKLSLKSLGGPITIFESAGNALNYGFISFIAFLAFLSLSIGIINFFPIPGLDGGHLFIQIIELIIRRPVPDKIQIALMRIGLLFILFILVQALVNDLLRIW